MKKIRVLLSDDHTLFRQGLRLLLEAADDMEVVGEAENGSRAVGEAKRLAPDVVLMDVAMPMLNGLEAARRIAREVPGVKVLILSSYSDDQHVQQALDAGAAGYVMKATASNDLFHAIREVCQGKSYFSPAIASRLSKQWRNREVATVNRLPELTSRQMQVLQLIAEGNSSKQIAALLFLSAKTVEKHRQCVMEKLNLHDIASLTRYAVSIGIVEINPILELQTATDPIVLAVSPMRRPRAGRTSTNHIQSAGIAL